MGSHNTLEMLHVILFCRENKACTSFVGNFVLLAMNEKKPFLYSS